MVGGRDRIKSRYDVESITQLLREYKTRIAEKELLEKPDEEIDFLVKCLNFVEPFEKDILEKTLIEGISLRSYANVSGLSRNTLARRRQRALDLIARYFNLKTK